MEVQGWIKLNIDGSRDNYVGNIAAGGVLTDATKQWITGLALNRGKGSVLEAEFWEIYKGSDLMEYFSMSGASLVEENAPQRRSKSLLATPYLLLHNGDHLL
ncbi:hypothetical protein ACOSQ3_011889 [Xanthoceras sorbifolium]